MIRRNLLLSALFLLISESASSESAFPDSKYMNPYLLDGLKTIDTQEVSDLASNGNPDAQFILGMAYYFSTHPDKNAIALNWFKRSAEAGNTKAMSFLAELLLVNDPENVTTAVYWFEKAAIEGVPFAQYNLGILYLTKKLAAADPRTGFNWLLKSAENGYEVAESEVANAYYLGRWVPEDKELAEKWALRAANKGNAQAQAILAFIYSENLDFSEAYFWSLLSISTTETTHPLFQVRLDLKNLLADMISEKEAAEIRHRASSWRAETKTNEYYFDLIGVN